ncbi:serine/threonine-protein kinase [Streptomyces sp. NPDC057705]|uniref:serine/threonine-protein kinase n=1 Tax=Streptomyces sp. NPDC057705 TaxID=3346222 RepID=UPI0036C9186A
MRLELDRDWVVGDPIGERGGFGAVYAAQDADGLPAAVKLVPKRPGAERELLFTELDGVRNVVPILDNGEHEDHWALVMPRAEKSLRAHLQQHGTLALADAVQVLTDIAETLTDLDGQVVHRDLKPENVLLLNGRWCLADFGIARYAEATTAQQTYKFAGTLAYMAPERWKNQRATSASDIYAFGVLAYELLEGTTPFTGPHEHDYQDQHLHGTPPPLTTAPALLAALITECLFRAPQGRPAAGNVLERLSRIPTSSLAGGLAALAEANRAEAARRSEADRQASADATEAERRRDLLDAARTSLSLISDQLLTTITNIVSTAEVRRAPAGWTIRLASADLTFTSAKETDPSAWNTETMAPFDVIAHATIRLTIPQDRLGYEGRSHSLWYADAKAAERYQWFETAFMHTPLRNAMPRLDPFFLNPHHEARGAVGTYMAMHQVAWPFTPLSIGDLDEFIDRWTNWLAKAASGELGHPRRMPERDPQGSWRK